MLETQAQIVVLLRAFEEADRDGRVLTPYARVTATRRALRVTGLANCPDELQEAESLRYSETVIRRARVLFDSLDRKIPGLRGMLRIAQMGLTTAPAVVAGALAVGLLTSFIGPRRQIDLLALPLLGIFAWNLLVYAVLLLSLGLRPVRYLRAPVSWLAERFLRGALWRRLKRWRISPGGPEEWKDVADKALIRFAAAWHRIAEPLLVSRVRRALHSAAAALGLGAIVGLQVRGFGLEHRVIWESAWLDARAVQWVLSTVLAPAASILGGEVGDVALLEGPGVGGEAAPWIHLYTVATLLYVVLPRIGLALVECWRCVVHADLAIDLREAYYRRLFTEWRGATRHVEIVPYNFLPSAAALTALRALLHDYFGARADVRIREPLAHGTAATSIDTIPRSRRGPWAPSTARAAELDDPERETCHVVLFNLAQTPDPAVHGSFLRELARELDMDRGQLLVVVDRSAYRERVADPQCWREQFRGWEQVAREAGLAAIELDPACATDDATVNALGAAIRGGSETIEVAGGS